MFVVQIYTTNIVIAAYLAIIFLNGANNLYKAFHFCYLYYLWKTEL